MRKTRRIEITAFRRTTTVAGDWPDARSSKESAHSQNDGLRSIEDHPAQLEQSDLVEAILSSDDACPGEWMHSIETLVVSEGVRARAAQQLGSSRNRFCLKLRSLVLSIKRLETGFGSSSQWRRNGSGK